MSDSKGPHFLRHCAQSQPPRSGAVPKSLDTLAMEEVYVADLPVICASDMAAAKVANSSLI